MIQKVVIWELGLLRKRSSSSGAQCLKRIKKNKQEFAYLIIIDFESTCWENVKYKTQEIIEFPAVLLNTATGKIDSEFHHYVQPQESPYLSDFCKQLTGITQEQVDQGIPLFLTLKRFSTWLHTIAIERNISYDAFSSHTTKCSFVTWSDWDLAVCLQYETRRKQLRKPAELNSWIDLRATYRNFYQRRPQGLNGALQDLGISFEGREHSGLCDSRNTAKLAWRMMTDGCMLHVTKTLTSTLTGQLGPQMSVPSAMAAPTKKLTAAVMLEALSTKAPFSHLGQDPKTRHNEDSGQPQCTVIGPSNKFGINPAEVSTAVVTTSSATGQQEKLFRGVQTTCPHQITNGQECNRLKKADSNALGCNAHMPQQDTQPIAGVNGKQSTLRGEQTALYGNQSTSFGLQITCNGAQTRLSGPQQASYVAQTPSNGQHISSRPQTDHSCPQPIFKRVQPSSSVVQTSSCRPQAKSNVVQTASGVGTTSNQMRISSGGQRPTSSELQTNTCGVPLTTQMAQTTPSRPEFHDAQANQVDQIIPSVLPKAISSGPPATCVRPGTGTSGRQITYRGPQMPFIRPKTTSTPVSAPNTNVKNQRILGPSFKIYSDPVRNNSGCTISNKTGSVQVAGGKNNDHVFKTPNPVGVGITKVSGMFKTPRPLCAPPTELSSTQIDNDRIPFSQLNTTDYRTPQDTRNASMVVPPTGSRNNMKRTPPMCDCGRRSHRKLVQSVGPNQGRAFYACTSGKKKGTVDNQRTFGGVKKQGCGFFKWESNLNSAAKNMSSSGSGSFLQTTLCALGQTVKRTQSFVIPPLPQPDFNTPGVVQKHTKDTKNTQKTLWAKGTLTTLAPLRY